ncbi:MAG: TVP38/TMEM64 family protein [Gemmatimonadota bacterium]|nr:TVP38/TMEM64 family protein [Gemmatimonadota bacterium]
MPNASLDAAAAEPADRPSAGGAWKRLLFGLLILIGLVVVARDGADRVPEILRRIDAMGAWAAVAYIALYMGAAVAWIPGSILTLAAGAIFGLGWGTLYTIVGATLGASLAFLVGRYIARAAIERRLGDSPKLRAVDDAVAKEGAKIVFLIRLSPVFPYNALNYALGLTQVRFRDYVPASALGMIPGTFMYVYAGHAAGQIAAGTAGAGPSGPGQYVLLTLGLVATIAVTVLVTRAAKRALQSTTAIEATPPDETD